MTIAFFSDLIAAVGKVASALAALKDLPKAERDKYRQVIDETYRLIDTTLSMVIIRLGDILRQDDASFVQELAALDNFQDWLRAEREFRLCRSLRIAVAETEAMPAHIVGRLSAKDWDALLRQMQSILASEGEVAGFIVTKFLSLASAGRAPTHTSQDIAALKAQIDEFRSAILAERQTLIQQEANLYSAVI